VWRHPNLRMAYVAQHAFHHLEEHLDTTPLKYMFKRFGLGQDQVRCAVVVFICSWSTRAGCVSLLAGDGSCGSCFS
jgi:hypothetical protein